MTELQNLNRTDLIKLVAQQVLDDLRTEVADCKVAVGRARCLFEDEAERLARSENIALLDDLGDACRFDVDDVVCEVQRCVYAESVLPSDVAVVMKNSALPFEQRMCIEVRVPLTGDLLDAAEQLQRALRALDDAEHRDTRVSTIKEKVRKDMVGELLKSGGDAADRILAASRELAVQVKERLLKQDGAK